MTKHTTYTAICPICERTFNFKGRDIAKSHAQLIEAYSCGRCARDRRMT